jgi:hypothetical protein
MNYMEYMMPSFSLARRKAALSFASPGDAPAEGSPMVERKTQETAAEPASPACSMHDADDQYMGYAGRDELVAFMNELLEAERAGARVTMETANAAGDSPLGRLMREIQHDEARWGGMLSGHLKRLGAVASAKTGAFYEKAMAVADLGERTVFLNRGQGWVVRKLREILPRVRDDAVHSDFAEMLRSHEENIARASELVGSPK